MTPIAPPILSPARTTPYGQGEDERLIKKRIIDYFLPQRADVREVFNEIDSLTELGPDWDGEDALPISSEAADTAKELVLSSARLAEAQGISWQPPTAAPTPDGGIDLFWQVRTRRVLLIIEPEHEDVVCVIKVGDSLPQRRLISFIDAAQVAMWAISIQTTS